MLMWSFVELQLQMAQTINPIRACTLKKSMKFLFNNDVIWKVENEV